MSYLRCICEWNAQFDNSDYRENQGLDQYDVAGLDDEQDFDAMDADSRAAAERKMARRDRKEGRAVEGDGARRRNRAPAFLQSDIEDERDRGLLPTRRRRRKIYDEAQDDDDDFDNEV